MKYHIHFDIAGLLVLIVLGIDFISKKHKQNKITRIYSLLLGVQIFTVTINVINSIITHERMNMPQWIPVLTWKLYAISIMTYAILFSRYCTSMIEDYLTGFLLKVFSKMKVVGWTAYLIAVLIMIQLEPVFIDVQRGQLEVGTSLRINIIFTFCTVAFSMLFVYMKRKFISRRHRICLNLVWFLGLLFLIIEFTFHLQIISFGMALIMLIIYFTLENPDFAIIEKLDEEKRHADDLNTAKNVFLAQVSHEIRTPMSIIMGMTEMIMREADDEKILEYANDINDSSKSLLLIINDILDFSKMEAGKIEIEQKNFDARFLIKMALSHFGNIAKDKGLEFKYEIDENIPSILYGDDSRLKQILANLLSNAVKYTKEGSIFLKMKCNFITEEDGSEVAEISTSVTDTGCGIREEDLPKVFEEFQRLNYGKNQEEGSGLGIPIVMRLLELMGSKLEVKSVFGEGSEFSFKNRLKIVNKTPIGKFSDFAVEPVEKPKTLMFHAPDAKILAVDDSDMNLYLFEIMLKRTQIQVDKAPSGKECLEKVRDNKYDVIFLDHMMPDMDGLETISRLKEIDSFISSKTPIVALTANAITGAKNMYMKEGFSDYISKPIDSRKLEEILLKYIPKEKIQK